METHRVVFPWRKVGDVHASLRTSAAAPLFFYSSGGSAEFSWLKAEVWGVLMRSMFGVVFWMYFEWVSCYWNQIFSEKNHNQKLMDCNRLKLQMCCDRCERQLLWGGWRCKWRPPTCGCMEQHGGAPAACKGMVEGDRGKTSPQNCVQDPKESNGIELQEEILHQLIGKVPHYLQGFIHTRCGRISSINCRWVHVLHFRIGSKVGWQDHLRKHFFNTVMVWCCMFIQFDGCILISIQITGWISLGFMHTHTHALTKLLITVKPKKHVEGEVIIMYSLIWWRYLSPPEKNPELLTSQEWYTAHMSPMTTLVAAQLLKELDLRKGTSTKMSLDTKLMKFSGQGFLFGMWGKFFWVMEGQHFLCGTKR